jgi:hypothetical protein
MSITVFNHANVNGPVVVHLVVAIHLAVRLLQDTLKFRTDRLVLDVSNVFVLLFHVARVARMVVAVTVGINVTVARRRLWWKWQGFRFDVFGRGGAVAAAYSRYVNCDRLCRQVLAYLVQFGFALKITKF